MTVKITLVITEEFKVDLYPFYLQILPSIFFSHNIRICLTKYPWQSLLDLHLHSYIMKYCSLSEFSILFSQLAQKSVCVK